MLVIGWRGEEKRERELPFPFRPGQGVPLPLTQDSGPYGVKRDTGGRRVKTGRITLFLASIKPGYDKKNIYDS